jgi:hypothetical protein
MSFIRAKKDAESIKEDVGGGSYISKSGIYDLLIIAPFISTGSGEVMGVDFYVKYNDKPQVLYGNLKLTNKDGTENFGTKIFNKLMIVAGVDEINDPIDGELPIGKDGAQKDVAILEDLTELDVKVRIQMEYSVYNGDIREKTIIKSFYSLEGASAEEIVNGLETGVQLAKDMVYAENVTYKDGLTAEQITAWIAAKRPKGTAGGGTTVPTKKPSFGHKKTFGAK